MDPAIEPGVGADDVTGAVGAVVVDHQDADEGLWRLDLDCCDGIEEPADGGRLVVGRDDDHATHARNLGLPP
jgi:hypothetical protein